MTARTKLTFAVALAALTGLFIKKLGALDQLIPARRRVDIHRRQPPTAAPG